MFKRRVLTAVCLVPLVVTGLYFANPMALWVVLCLLGLGCGYEWTALIPINAVWGKISYLLVLGLLFYLIAFCFMPWLITGLILWILLAYWVVRFPARQAGWGKPWLVGLFGLCLIPLFIQSVYALFLLSSGRYFVLFLLIFVWASDSGAYLVGKAVGYRRLIPRVSPGKTVEGFFGGLMLATVIGFCGYLIFDPHLVMFWYFFIVFMYITTVFGDLFMSMLKRRVGLKDTGAVFPGHGGVLDRMDSLIAASPFFYLGLLCFLHGF